MRFRLIQKSINQVIAKFQFLNESGDIVGSINLPPQQIDSLLRQWSGPVDRPPRRRHNSPWSGDDLGEAKADEPASHSSRLSLDERGRSGWHDSIRGLGRTCSWHGSPLDWSLCGLERRLSDGALRSATLPTCRSARRLGLDQCFSHGRSQSARTSLQGW